MSANNSRRAFRLSPLSRAIVAGFGLGACASASALDWQLGDLGIDLNTRASAGFAMRVQGADPTYIGIANGGKAYSSNVDFGELSFGHAGDLVSEPMKLNSALTLTYKEFGVFARGYYDYDPVLQNHQYFNLQNYGPNKTYSVSEYNAQQQGDRDHLGHPSSILDLYAYGSEDVWGHNLSVKIGKQVVNWGESTLVLNGLNSLVPLDADKAHLPGAEISEFVVPVPQVFASLSLAEETSIEGFYQWKFLPTVVDAAGGFYPIPDQNYAGLGGMAGDISYGRALPNSLAGTSCPGGNDPGTASCIPYGPNIPHGSDVKGKGTGQYGGAFRFVIPQLNETEVALYAATYTDRLPLYSATSAVSALPLLASSANYFIEYPDHVHMYGFSFNTSLPWGLAFQGEYSYKPNQPFQINAVEVQSTALGAQSQLNPLGSLPALGGQYIRGWRRKEISQLDFGLTKVLSGSTWFKWDEAVLVAEIAGDRVHNLEGPSALAYEGPATWQPNTASEVALSGVPMQQGGYPTANSWGYKLLAHSTYNNVLTGGLALEPGLRFDHDVKGITPVPFDNFVENSRMLSPTLGWRYLSNLTGEIGYNTFFGGGSANLLRDRDFVETYVRYAF